MRKVVLSTYTTLDGVMSPLDWHFPFWDEEMGRYARDLLFSSDALLMGRDNYEGFAPVWSKQTAADDAPGAPGFTDRINSMPKFVASTTLKDPLEWNATLIIGNLVNEVAKLKRKPGQNILMYGAGPVGQLLLKNGLVDELQFLVHPVVWGIGDRVFQNATDLPELKLVSTTAFDSGIVLLTYRPLKTNGAKLPHVG